jgi:hypothetical protein
MIHVLVTIHKLHSYFHDPTNKYALTNSGQATMPTWQDDENNKTQITDTQTSISIYTWIHPLLRLFSSAEQIRNAGSQVRILLFLPDTACDSQFQLFPISTREEKSHVALNY